MSQLDETLHSQVTELSEAGNLLFDAGDYEGAAEKFDAAWQLLPEPKTEWESALWLLAAKADSHFVRQQYAEAIAALTRAAMCPEGLGNPFLHLRLGQAHFEMGDQARAGNELTMAYMAAGSDIFEDEDPKYFDYLKTILQPPVGQQTL
ncbi:MAG: tol-pal system YbgF family protein [Blastopirellula sp. JB062]